MKRVKSVVTIHQPNLDALVRLKLNVLGIFENIKPHMQGAFPEISEREVLEPQFWKREKGRGGAEKNLHSEIPFSSASLL